MPRRQYIDPSNPLWIAALVGAFLAFVVLVERAMVHHGTPREPAADVAR